MASLAKSYENIFRLSAVLYKDENYNTSRENTIRKIIESIFVENNDLKSLSEVVLLCSEKYDLIFDLKEFEEIIRENTDKFYVKRDSQTNVIKIALTEKRLKSISSTINNGVEDYVNRFLEVSGIEDKINAKNIIYKFLYDVFTSNLDNYKYFLTKPSERKTLKISNNKYGSEDVKLINDFLCFDDTGKDRAIFGLVSLSLEYCMLTGNGKEVYIEGIKNKIFYLDSNIIYRAIGVNGDLRKKLTLNFLKKCLELNINIKISQFADREFQESIAYYINRISSFGTHKVSSMLTDLYLKEDGIFSFYYEWCSGKSNIETSYFEAYIHALYRNFLDVFKIELDYNEYFKNDDPEIDVIQKSILEYKSKYSRDLPSSNIIQYDAKMILSMTKLRIQNKDEHKKLLETKNFLITTDHLLKDWAQQYSPGTTMLLLPSEWLAIMLRFVGRTADDYKSFVSFITLKKNEQTISSERIFAVLNGISELTQDLETQKRYADEIISKRVEGIISSDTATDTYMKTKEYVDKKLATEIAVLKDKFIVQERKTDELINNEKNEKEEIQKANKDITEENKILKNELIKKDIKEWQNVGYWAIIPTIFFGIYFLLHFLFIESSYNFVVNVIYIWESSLPESSRKVFDTLDYMACFSGVGYFSNIAYSRIRKDSIKYKEQLELIRNKYK